MTSENKTPSIVHLSVRRWRDRVNGNSYFSARLIVDGVVHCIPFQYGYGSQPMAVAMTEARGHVAAFANARSCYIDNACADAGIAYTHDEATVTKRDCVAHGRED